MSYKCSSMHKSEGRQKQRSFSAHLMTEAGIDEFVDDALAELEEIRIDAKKALAAADSN
jgi:hypothetical protein